MKSEYPSIKNYDLETNEDIMGFFWSMASQSEGAVLLHCHDDPLVNGDYLLDFEFKLAKNDPK